MKPFFLLSALSYFLTQSLHAKESFNWTVSVSFVEFPDSGKRSEPVLYDVNRISSFDVPMEHSKLKCRVKDEYANDRSVTCGDLSTLLACNRVLDKEDRVNLKVRAKKDSFYKIEVKCKADSQ